MAPLDKSGSDEAGFSSQTSCCNPNLCTVRASTPSAISTYTTHRNLNGILAAMMLEYGISQQTLPQETRLRRLVTFMKDYGTERMDGDRIIGYLRRLDEAMNHVPISESIRRISTVENVQRKRMNLLSIGERTPSRILLPQNCER